jgi:hypothetical protein
MLVNCGDVVVETWFLGGAFPATNCRHFFEIILVQGFSSETVFIFGC